ncbi:anion permease [Paraburkholderia silviterrae]|uniref:Uncharacterized protein n=1 Tax=Paraburkholderia silviterrae TaxID=2528715 RepID=A0A4R5M9C7_9BURK|nr:anion permease [Paraburkholderia silviterrae]TDG22824.1 hypothetical protein EYW47_16560 [Paraburkholderia silviterrae]
MNAAKPDASTELALNKPGLPIGLIAGAIALVVVLLLLPLPASLPVAGQRMLAILAFAVVVWLTEAVSYEASATALTSAMPLGYTVSFGFILPINAPQNMVCLATETFTAKQFARVGIAVTMLGYLLLLLFAATWWRWLSWI